MALVKLLLSLAVAVSLAAEPVHALYESSPNVKLLSPANFDRVLSKTSQPTFVEFYAPWCGHCQKLQSEYEQAAKRALGIAKFYAVDCDNESNRGLCARFSVQGFPTIKVFTEKRTKRGNRKSVDYQGERSARAMVGYARSILPNFSKKLSADGLDVFIANSSRLPKAVLLTERAKTSDLWKGLSALFSNQVDFAQISNPEQQTLERFGVTELPTVVAFSAITDPSQFEIYKGEIKYLPLAKFIKNVSTGRKTAESEVPHKKAFMVDRNVKEIASQGDLESLCIEPGNKSPIPVMCIIGVVTLEPEFEESREEHAQAIKTLEYVLRNQRMRGKYAHSGTASSSSSQDINGVDHVDEDDKDEHAQQSEAELSPPFRVAWVNALGTAGQKIRTIFELSDDLPSAVAISPRKSAAAPYVGPFDANSILAWADKCYQGHGMRRFAFDLDIINKKHAHDEL